MEGKETNKQTQMIDLEISERYIKLCETKYTLDQALNYDSLLVKHKAFGPKYLRMLKLTLSKFLFSDFRISVEVLV